MKALAATTGVILWCAVISIVISTPPVRPGTGNPSPRLPRTSASQLSQLNNSTTVKSQATKNVPNTRNGNLQSR